MVGRRLRHHPHIQFIVNTTQGEQAIKDSVEIRKSAVTGKICYTTTVAGGKAACLALEAGDQMTINPLQSLHRQCEDDSLILSGVTSSQET